MSRRQFWSLPALVSALALLLTLLVAPTAFAADTASVSGSITGAGGAALPSGVPVSVQLLWWRDSEDGGRWDALYETTMDAEHASYSFGSLPAGMYRVRAVPDGGSYGTTNSSAFTLTEGQAKTNVTIALQVGATITGTISGPQGEPLSGVSVVTVAAQLWVDDEEGNGHWSWERSEDLDPSHLTYSIANLTAGKYRIVASPLSGNYFTSYSPEVTVVAGQTLTGVNIALDRGATVSGTITGPGGAALSGVSEIAVEIECLLADGGGTWEVVRDAHLGAGETSYAVSNLTAGTYRIRVSAVGGTYLATYSPEFTLVAGQHKSGFAVALASTVPVVNPPVPPAVVRHATSVKVKAKGAKKKATLTVSVAAAGVPVSAVGGKVVVYAKGKKVKTVSLKKGKVKVVVKKQKKGKIAYTVKYLGNSSLLPSAKIVKVKIK